MTDDDPLAALLRAHRAAERAERAAEKARDARDDLIADAIDAGITPYRIAKTLGLAQSTPVKMAARAAARRSTEVA